MDFEFHSKVVNEPTDYGLLLVTYGSHSACGTY